LPDTGDEVSGTSAPGEEEVELNASRRGSKGLFISSPLEVVPMEHRDWGWFCFPLTVLPHVKNNQRKTKSAALNAVDFLLNGQTITHSTQRHRAQI
jgi:hypothetical protein